MGFSMRFKNNCFTNIAFTHHSIWSAGLVIALCFVVSSLQLSETLAMQVMTQTWPNVVSS